MTQPRKCLLACWMVMWINLATLTSVSALEEKMGFKDNIAWRPCSWTSTTPGLISNTCIVFCTRTTRFATTWPMWVCKIFFLHSAMRVEEHRATRSIDFAINHCLSRFYSCRFCAYTPCIYVTDDRALRHVECLKARYESLARWIQLLCSQPGLLATLTRGCDKRTCVLSNALFDVTRENILTTTTTRFRGIRRVSYR